MNATSTPQRIMMLGDLHGDTSFATKVIRTSRRHKIDLIIQVGDFGYDTDVISQRYLDAVNTALEQAGLTMLVVDGNHENHDALQAAPVNPETGLRPLHDHITHLPRGYTWTWDDTVWVAAGGASSINSHHLTPGYDWWPGEIMNAAEQQRVLNAGTADILVTHDAPWGTPTLTAAYKQHLPIEERNQMWPLTQIAMSDRHQQLIRDLCDELEATRVIHGHHHHRYDDTITRPELPDLHVHGLGMNGQGQDAWMIVGPTGHPLPRTPETA